MAKKETILQFIIILLLPVSSSLQEAVCFVVWSWTRDIFLDTAETSLFTYSIVFWTENIHNQYNSVLNFRVTDYYRREKRGGSVDRTDKVPVLIFREIIWYSLNRERKIMINVLIVYFLQSNYKRIFKERFKLYCSSCKKSDNFLKICTS